MLGHEGDRAATSILIAEDEAVIALELCAHFRHLGYQVLGPTRTGEDTVELALATSPSIILMDVQLLGSIDGAAAAVEIRKSLDVPIVFVTAHSDEHTLARALSSEPDAYVLKPFETKSLAVTVRLALSRHQASQARARAEAAQRRAEAHTRIVLDHCHDAVVSVDSDGRITAFNRGAETVFEASAQDMLGQPLSELLPVENVAQHELEFQRFRAGGETERVMARRREVMGRRKGGGLFPAEITISKAIIEGDEVLTACIRDVTERKALEEQFAQAQKMEVVGRLAASVAHDFNNVLTAIQSSTYLLKVGAAPGALALLADLSAASDRGAALCRQLLGFCRHASERLEIVSTNDLIVGVEPLLRHLLPRNITLRLELSDSAGRIRVDPTLIELILMNLVTNGRDAMPFGGELVIRSDAVSLGDAGLEPLLLRPGAYARLRVSDTGQGVTPEVAMRMFEPFFTTKPRGFGTGLGLSTVRMLARDSGGDARLCSQPGQSATLEVLLPLTQSVATCEQNESPVAARRHGNEAILILDGDTDVSRALAQVLGSYGYVTHIADTPNAAFRVLRSGEKVDLLLAELALGRMALSVEDVQQLNLVRPQMPVIFLRSSGDPLPNLGPGITREPILDKPISAGVLLDAIRKRLDARDMVQGHPSPPQENFDDNQ
ncbi:MAG: response regulator [Polyangiaceae bacterium]|nr:response regulator [Polyangiaceae bacterium]